MTYTPIPIFAAERDAGLAELINSAEARIVRCYSKVTPATSPLPTCDIQLVEAALGSSRDQFDLFPLHAVLATVGTNKNDDVFDGPEMWQARATPVDHPFNCEHNPRKIIGHITSSFAVDEEFQVIADTTVVDDLPSKFHIVTGAVVYRHIKSLDEDLEKESADLIGSIIAGEYFVSMEALFSGFDYLCVASDGEQKIVNRCKDSAYLTKHLRTYGGTGVYNNERLYRVLRGIAFSGKGLTKKPANEESIIINDDTVFQSVSKLSITSGANLMNEAEKIISLESKVAELAKANTELTSRLSKMDEEKVQAQVNEFKATIAERDASIASLKAEADKVVELTKANETAIATKVEVEKSLIAVQAELNIIKADIQKTNRVSTLVDKGVDKVEAETIVTKWVSASDEQFADIVAMQTELVEAKKMSKKEADAAAKKAADEKAGGCGASATDTETDKVGEVVADVATAAVETAVATETPTTSTPATPPEAEVEAARATLANFLGGLLGHEVASE